MSGRMYHLDHWDSLPWLLSAFQIPRRHHGQAQAANVRQCCVQHCSINLCFHFELESNRSTKSNPKHRHSVTWNIRLCIIINLCIMLNFYINLPIDDLSFCTDHSKDRLVEGYIVISSRFLRWNDDIIPIVVWKRYAVQHIRTRCHLHRRCLPTKCFTAMMSPCDMFHCYLSVRMIVRWFS